MPQLQKAMPPAAAPFKKFLRVVIDRLPRLFPRTGRLTCRFILHLVADQIAKLDAEEQSFLEDAGHARMLTTEGEF
jgi:hypothetical protein